MTSPWLQHSWHPLSATIIMSAVLQFLEECRVSLLAGFKRHFRYVTMTCSAAIRCTKLGHSMHTHAACLTNEPVMAHIGRKVLLVRKHKQTISDLFTVASRFKACEGLLSKTSLRVLDYACDACLLKPGHPLNIWSTVSVSQLLKHCVVANSAQQGEHLFDQHFVTQP